MTSSERRAALVDSADSSFAAELEEGLSDSGYPVTRIASFEQTACMLASGSFDVVFLTGRPEGRSWSEMLSRTKEMAGEATVLVITRALDEADLRGALNAGAYRVWDRPLGAAALTSLIDHNRAGAIVLLRE